MPILSSKQAIRQTATGCYRCWSAMPLPTDKRRGRPPPMAALRAMQISTAPRTGVSGTWPFIKSAAFERRVWSLHYLVGTALQAENPAAGATEQAVLDRKAHIGEHIVLSLVHEAS